MNIENVREITRKVALTQSQQVAYNAATNQNSQQRLLQDLLSGIAFGGALGVGGRGLLGLYRMATQAPQTQQVDPGTIKMPGIRKRRPKEEEIEKTAGAENSMVDWAGETTRWLTSGNKPSEIPIGPALMYTSIPLAAYAGWKGLDMASDTIRAKRRKAQESIEKAEYESLLRRALSPTKRAEAETTEENDLDAGFSALRKTAEIEPYIDSLLGDGGTKWLAKNYLTYALPAGLISGYLTYNATLPRTRKAVIDKAERERRRRQGLSANYPLIIEPEDAEQ